MTEDLEFPIDHDLRVGVWTRPRVNDPSRRAFGRWTWAARLPFMPMIQSDSDLQIR